MNDLLKKLAGAVKNKDLQLDLDSIPLDTMEKKANEAAINKSGQILLEGGVLPAVKVVDYLGGATRTGVTAPFRTEYSNKDLLKFIKGEEMWPAGDELVDKIQEKNPGLIQHPGLSATIATGLEFTDPLNYLPGSAPVKTGAKNIAKKAALESIRKQQASAILKKLALGGI